MKTLKVSINSRADLKRQIDDFKKRNPNAVVNERSFSQADAAAMRLDNETVSPGGRMGFEIEYDDENPN